MDDFLVLSFDVDPSEDFPFEVSFEIEPTTNLTGGVEFANIATNGMHRPSFWDMAAELRGVVVSDAVGTPIPNVSISSEAGYDYPVDTAPPVPVPPQKVILSPVAAIDSDLGEFDPVDAPFERMLDQSGLVVPFTSGQTGFDVYFTNPDANESAAASGLVK